MENGDLVDEKFVESYSYFGGGADINSLIPVRSLNGQSAVLKPEKVPEDRTFDLILFQKSQVYRVPITVSFAESPDYDPNIFSSPVTAESLNHYADVIFTGVALSSKNQTTNGILYGEATISVGTWLKGEGLENVTFGNFGDSSADCLESIQLNQPYIFFLKKDGENYRAVRSQGFGISKWTYSEQNMAAIKMEVGQQPLEFDFEESIRMASTGEKPFEIKTNESVPAAELRRNVSEFVSTNTIFTPFITGLVGLVLFLLTLKFVSKRL